MPASVSSSRVIVEAWVRQCFLFGSEMLASHPGLRLQQVVELARGGTEGEPTKVEPLLAAGVHASCMALPGVAGTLAADSDNH